MENSLQLNDFHIKKTNLIFNRIHIFFHGIALSSLFYYRIKSLSTANTVPFLPHFLLFISELILSFIWFLAQASKWKPITRNAYIERLPENERLPSIDAFICTADPDKEPSVEVMNTVISAMAMDYPFDKFTVYVSDDGGSSVTFRAVQEAWKFSRFWIPFCRKYGVKNRCPKAYFLKKERNDDVGMLGGSEFAHEKKIIEQKYDEFKNCLEKIIANTRSSPSKDHPPIIEVINDANGDAVDSCKDEMPLLVYISREKRPSYPHHFKAGSLNVLLRVSAMITNSPYILVLDCDMYCNDPTSARQAMCFHLDSKLSQKLAFVQFPQRFHTISETDIIDSQLRFVWERWEGLDGLKGPILSGTGFYIKRKALYGTNRIQQDSDLIKLQTWYGSSYEFIKSMYGNYQPNYPSNGKLWSTLLKEMQLLASCTYDKGTNWGREVGFSYFSVVEDYFTGFNLHCEGWNSVFINPTRPCFLGASPICLNDTFVQHTRWGIGLMQVALSRFSPVLYGPLKMSILQSMGCAELAFTAIYCIPLYALAIVPQLCLICGLPLYPKVSSPFFLLFTFIFLSSQIKHIQEIFLDGHSIDVWWIEQRMWMMKSTTCYFYATLHAILEKIGLTKSSFVPTNKVVDDEQEKRYRLGIYDFQASALFMVPLCSLYILNMACFIIGIVRILITQKGDEMFIQAFIPVFGMIVNYPLLEGMVLRKDKGRILPSISIISAVISVSILCVFSLLSIY